MAQSTRDKLKAANALGLRNKEPVPVVLDAPVEDFSPSDPELDAREKEGDDVTFGQAAAASFRVDNSGYSLYRDFVDPRFFYDKTFSGVDAIQENKERIDKLTLADGEDLYELLGGAYNKDHFDHLLTTFEAKQADEELIMQAGGMGMLARVGANVGDPVDIGVTLLAAPLGGAVKANKWGRILSTAATAGGANALIEGKVSQENPFRDETDIAFAGAAGIVMGGSISFLTRKQNLEVEAIANKRAVTVLDEAIPDSAGAQRRVLTGEFEDEADVLSKSGEDALDNVTGGDAVPEYVPLFSMVDGLTTSLRGKFKDGSESGRAMYDALFEGGFVKDKLKTRQHTAEGYADAIDRAVGARIIRDTDPHFKDWAQKELNMGPKQADVTVDAGENFYTQVGLAIRNIDDPSISSQAKAAAAKMQESFREIWDLAQAAGVKGFEGDPLDNWLPRIYNKRKMTEAFRKFDEEPLRAFFREAIKSGQDDISEELASIFAKSMVRTLRRSSAGMDSQMSGGIPIDDLEELRRFFTDGLEGEDLTKATADFDRASEMLEAQKSAKSSRDADAGKIDRAKRRVRLNEGYKDFVEGKDGQAHELKFTDLLHNDARAVGLRYTQVMAGHIGLARKGIKSQGDFDRALDGIRSREEGRADPQKIDQEVKALKRGHRLLTGRSVEADPQSTGSQLSRTFRDSNFIRSSGGFGMAQLAEFGNTIAIGVGRMFGRHLPEFANLTKRAADGTLDNKVAAQIETWFGAGTDFMRHPAIRGFDEFGEGFEGTSKLQQAMAKADAPIQVMKRVASVVSFMSPIVTRMERQASIGHVVEFTSRVHKGQLKFGKAKAARWRGAGMDDAMQARVFKQIKAKAKFDSKGRLEDLNVKEWDPEIAEAMQLSVRRQASFTVQRNDLADIPESMRGPVGRLVFQFKAFMFGSIVKQLERGMHYRDIETFVAWTTSWFIASMAYVGQTMVETVGNPELREEKLSIEQIAGAGFSRAGWTALLVPIAATIADITGNDGMFNHRYSGFQSSLLSADQNPTSQLIGGVLGTAKALTLDNIDPDTRGIGKTDAQRGLSLIPYNRVLGVKNVLHLFDE